MASDFNTKLAPNLFRLIMSRFGATRAAKDGFGTTVSVTLMVHRDSSDVERTPAEIGRDTVQRTSVGILSSSTVNDKWTFDVLGDGDFWAVDRETAGIVRIADEMFMVPVIRAEIFDRGNSETQARD